MARNTKYRQVVNWIAQRIEKKELVPGDRLESEQELCERFQVSRQTIRHALRVLNDEGMIESRQGSGSFIKGITPLTSGSGSRTIVIISTYVNGYIFPRVIQGMARVLEKNGWNIQIKFTHNKKEIEKNILIKLLEEPDLRGLIIEPTMSGLPNMNRGYYEQIRKRGIPVLFFHSFYENLDIPHVSLDDEKSARLLVEYLLENGHSKIGAIFKLDDGQGKRRYTGYLKALTKAGVSVSERNVSWIDTEDQRNMELCSDKIVKRLEYCTACLCYNDEVAHALTEICRQRNIAVPEQLSIVSIDNSELAQLNSVPLTSIVHPMEKLGEKTAENMLSLIRNPLFQATYEFSPEIEIRQSVKKINL